MKSLVRYTDIAPNRVGWAITPSSFSFLFDKNNEKNQEVWGAVESVVRKMGSQSPTDERSKKLVSMFQRASQRAKENQESGMFFWLVAENVSIRRYPF